MDGWKDELRSALQLHKDKNNKSRNNPVDGYLHKAVRMPG